MGVRDRARSRPAGGGGGRRRGGRHLGRRRNVCAHAPVGGVVCVRSARTQPRASLDPGGGQGPPCPFPVNPGPHGRDHRTDRHRDPPLATLRGGPRARESFGKGQKGSSAMPHKRNPIASENLTGIARVLRGYASAGLEDVALWHERDISHSSVERIVLPDATTVLHYALRRSDAGRRRLVRGYRPDGAEPGGDEGPGLQPGGVVGADRLRA